MCCQHVLNFGQRLLAQIRGLEKLDLGTLNQVTDEVNAFRLQAVRRTNGQFQIIDRTSRIGSIFRDVIPRAPLPCLADQQTPTAALEEVAARRTASGSIVLDVDNQFIQVGTLLNTGAVNRIGHLAHRAE